MKLVYEVAPGTSIDHDEDDGGMAQILEVPLVGQDEDAEDGTFVRVQSWSDNCNHPEMDALLEAHAAGKTIRVTVEII